MVLPACSSVMIFSACGVNLFSMKDGVVILCDCLGTVQYWWISIGLVTVQFSAVFYPSVQYLVFFSEAFSWTILNCSNFTLFHSGQVFPKVGMLMVFPKSRLMGHPKIAWQQQQLCFGHTGNSDHNQICVLGIQGTLMMCSLVIHRTLGIQKTLTTSTAVYLANRECWHNHSVY